MAGPGPGPGTVAPAAASTASLVSSSPLPARGAGPGQPSTRTGPARSGGPATRTGGVVPRATRAGLVPHRDRGRGLPRAGQGAVIGGPAGRVAEHLPGLGQGAESVGRASVGRAGVRMLVPGAAPPGLRDLLPGGIPGHSKQLVQVRVRTAVIRSGHDRHLPFASRSATSRSQYASEGNLSRGLSGKALACYINPVSVT